MSLTPKAEMIELVNGLPAWMSVFIRQLEAAIEKGQGNLGTVEGQELLEEFAKWEIFLYRNSPTPSDLNIDVVYSLFKVKDYLYPFL